MGLVVAVFLGMAAVVRAEAVTVPNTPKNAGAVKSIDVSISPATAKRGETVIWKLTVRLGKDWHIYPLEQVDPAAGIHVTTIKFEPSPAVVQVEKLKDPPGFLARPEPVEQTKELRYYEGRVTWDVPLVVNPNATPGQHVVTAKFRWQVCDAHNCLPWEEMELTTPLTVSTESVAVDPKFAEAVRKAAGSVAAPPSAAPPEIRSAAQDIEAQSAEAYRAAMQANLDQLHREQAQDTGLLAFLLAGVFWGAVSLVTPCVFPMIPITVSYFLKQSDKEHHRPLTMAVIYCATIVTVLTVAAVLLLSFFRQLSINPAMNFALGALFVFFALSLFGMYEIELPSGLARFTSAREGRGGLVGTMFMALTFTIVSFACVAPFLGGFGGTAATAQRSWVELALGGLAFSLTFASPFFVLALFPSLLKQLPKSGSWLNSVKVVMGFLELAAALKFFRLGELLLSDQAPSFFTYDLVLGLWVALSLLCGLYLLNVYRLPHDTPADHLGVPQLMFSLLFLGLGFYLLPALFKYNAQGESQRPGGTIYAWVDSFLLPEAHGGKGALAWSPDLPQAIRQARLGQASGKRNLVFIDFTGESCTNCRLNERNVFPDPEIQNLFKQYQLVQLYTDKLPAEYVKDPRLQREYAKVNLWFQREGFGTEQLPLYVILEPLADGKTIRVVGQYKEGTINDKAAFAEFLRKPLVSAGSTASAGVAQ
jgi:thiol:disulfide interchange protein DsbD